mgnify:CR=1 FL=1
MLLTSLDLLVIVFMVLASVSLLALSLMFLVRNPRIKKVCIVALLGIYMGYVGFRIGSGLFPVQTALGVLVAVAAIASIVLALTCKNNEKKFKIARLVAAGSLIVGFANAFMI